MKQDDYLQRFLFDSAPARGALVHIQHAWQQLLALRTYPPALQTILGNLIAAAQLMTANLKFEGSLTLQIEGEGPVHFAVAECQQDRTFRAMAKWDEDVDYSVLSLPDMLGTQAQCAITLTPKQQDNRSWQGIVPVEGNTIAHMLENYMKYSEQLDTRFVLVSTPSTIGGMLLQKLPEGLGSQDDWARIQLLGGTLQDDELLMLSDQTILHRLFHEETIHLFTEEMVNFVCNCNKERVENMLLALGTQEVGDILEEQGSVEIICEYCNQHYVFDEDEIDRLFGDSVIEAAQEQRH